MISIEQIKAARALLEWTQDDLAKAAGLSKPSINNIERRIAQPKVSTILAIQAAFEKGGVEFTDGPGVKLNSTPLKTLVWEGDDSLLRLTHDIFETLNGTDGILMIAGVEEKRYKGLAGDRVLKEIKKRIKHKIKTQMLIAQGDTNFLEPIHHYRWMPKEFFPRTPYYIYGNKYAIFLWGPPKKIVLIENAEIAQSYRAQFEGLWAVSKPVKV